MSENLTPASESFRHHGRNLRIVMQIPTPEQVANLYDPPTEKPGTETMRFISQNMVHVLPVGKVTKPTVGFGVWCPAGFIVEGLPYHVDFSIRSSGKREKPIAVTGLNVRLHDLDDDGITTENLGSIPVARLLAAAMNAAAVTVIHYPANYDGPRHEIGKGGTLIATDDTVRTFDTPGILPLRRAEETPSSHFTNAAAGVMALSGEARLREVARIVRECDAEGLPSGQRVADRFECDPRHARRLVQEARDAGYLDPLPATDRRTRRSKP